MRPQWQHSMQETTAVKQQGFFQGALVLSAITAKSKVRSDGQHIPMEAAGSAAEGTARLRQAGP